MIVGGQYRKSLIEWLDILNECLVGKFLRKVLTGFIIMKPDMWGGKIRRRCPETKRVLGQSKFLFRFHRVTNERERERERERSTQKSTKHISISKKDKRRYVCMNMWQENLKASRTQPNPNLPAHNISIYIEHTSKMHEPLLKCKCDAMHEHTWSFK